MATLSILKRASKLPRSFSFSRVSGNPRQLRFEIPGAVGSPWEGLRVKGLLEFPLSYPTGSVSFFVRPSIYHPNVDPYDGLVCVGAQSPDKLAVLKTGKCVDFHCSVLMTLHSVMLFANPGDCYNQDAAALYARDKALYKAKARADALKKFSKF